MMKTFVNAGAIVAVMLLYLGLIGSPVWGTNDDVAMSMYSAGVLISDGPSVNLGFINPMYGRVLAFFNGYFPNFQWYGLLFLFVVSTSVFIINATSLNSLKTDIKKIFFYVFIIDLALIFTALSHLQFTIVAGMSCLAGCVFVCSIHQLESSVRFILCCLLASALIFVGSLIRFESAVMVVLLCMPYLLYKYIFKNHKHKQIIVKTMRSVLVLLLFISTFMVSKYTGDHLYKIDGWGNWKALNEVKAEFVDLNRIDFAENKQVFDRYLFTETDYKMLKTWNYVDSEYFSANTIQSIVNDPEIKRHPPYANSFSARIVDLFRPFDVLIKHTPILTLLALGLFLLAANFSKNRLELAIIVGPFVLIYLYLSAYLMRAEYRVLVVMLMSFVVLMGNSLVQFLVKDGGSNCNSPSNQKIFWQLFLFMFCLFFINFTIAARTEVANRKNNRSEMYSMLDKWESHLPEGSVIYVMGATFCYECIFPLDRFKKLQNIKGFIGTGWLNQTPHQENLLRFNHLPQYGFYRELASHGNVYILGPLTETHSLLTKFYWEKYKILLKFYKANGLKDLWRMEFERN